MIYLSIDLDYWSRHSDPTHCNQFFDQVFDLKQPIMVALSHHHLFLDMESGEWNQLWNIDWHSDLPDEPVSDFNEGTWAAFLSWRSYGQFVWRYPSEKCLSTMNWGGYCHHKLNPFEEPKATRWLSTRLKKGTNGIPWDLVKRIGLVLSPCWVGDLEIIEYPLKRLKVWNPMKKFYNLNISPGSFHDVRDYPPKLVRI